MTYEKPEALEVGMAADVILGAKEIDPPMDEEFLRPTGLVVEEL